MDKKTLTGAILLTSFLTALGSSIIDTDDTVYYCESRDLICIGERLSSTGKTCYYNVDGTTKGLRCFEGWTVYSMSVPEPATGREIFANNCLHTCGDETLTGEYTLCFCESGQWAYLGEIT